MTAREELIDALHNGWACYGAENEPGAFRRLATEMVDAHAHELAEKIRSAPHDGTGDTWNWWDAATIPGECAALIDPKSA